MEVTVNGVKLWYDIQGEGEPLLVTGGFYMAHHQFEFATPHLASRCQVINWDYEGTGLATRTIPNTDIVEHWADQLCGLLDALKLPRVSLWGTANGALIVLLFASKYPDRVNKLISHPWYKSDEKVRRFFQTSSGVVDIYGLQGHVKLMMTTLGFSDDYLFSPEGRAFEQWRLQAGERSTSVANYKKMCELLGQVDLTERVKGIQAPTLLLVGGTGPLGRNPTVDSQAAYLLETLPDCHYQTVPQAGGTLFMVQKPKESADIVLDFLLGR